MNLKRITSVFLSLFASFAMMFFVASESFAATFMPGQTIDYNWNTDVTLTAQYAECLSAVKFDGNKPSDATGDVRGTMADQTIACGETLALPSNKFSLNGWKFTGWNTKSDGSGIAYADGASFVASTGANSAVTLYAQWKVNEGTITFDANGGTGGVVYYYKEGTMYSDPNYENVLDGWMNVAVPTRRYGVSYEPNGAGDIPVSYADYVFEGYYSGDVLVYSADGSMNISGWANVNVVSKGESLSLVAKWTPASVTLPTVTRAGYTFGGWYSNSSLTTKVGDAGASYTPTANVTLYAKWTANTFNVAYANGGGTGSAPTSPVKCTYGTACLAPANTYARAGYEFNGWSCTASSGSCAQSKYAAGADISKVTTVAGATITLTATWKTGADNTITLDAAGGTIGGTYADTCNVSSEAITLPTPTKTGYTFVGWYDANDTKVETIAKGTCTEDISLTARWSQSLYVLSLDNADATTNGTSQLYVVKGNAIYLDAEATQRMTLGSNPIMVPRREYTVTYDADSGSVSPTSATASYIFGGYYDGTNLVINGQGHMEYDSYILSFISTSYPALKAKWTSGSVTLPTPTRAGYTFGGWYSNSSLTTKVGDAGASYTPTANVTLYAKWTAKLLTITLNNAGATSYGASSVYFKPGLDMYLDSDATKVMTTTTNPIAVPSRGYDVAYEANGGTVSIGSANGWAGYTFDGYYTNNGYQIILPSGYVANGQSGYITSTQTADLTLTAKWTGGSVTLPAPSRMGYTFAGWYSDSALTSKVGDAGASYTPGKVGVTLYAKWTPNVYKVTFKDATGQNIYQTVYYKYNTAWYSDAAATKPIAALTEQSNPGYTFGGFAASKYCPAGPSSTGITSWYLPPVGSIVSDTELYACWTANTFNVAYANGGGTGSAPTSPTSCTYAGTCRAPANTYTRAGYEFNGWTCTASSGACAKSNYAAGADISKATTVAGATITLTATWKTGAEKTITLDTAGGVIMSGSSVVSGSTCTVESADIVLPTPTKTGYTFVGWYDANDTKVETIAKGTCTEDISLTARWTANTITISYDTGVGVTLPDTICTYGQDCYLAEIDSFSKAGHVFLGWAKSFYSNKLQPGQNVKDIIPEEGNMELGAVWKKCSECSGTGVSCQMSVVNNVCTYTTTCLDGYGNMTNSGEYNASCSLSQFTITYSGSDLGAGKCDIGSAMTLPTDVTKTGYTFAGWYTAETGGTRIVELAAGECNADMTVYARWTPNTYTITLDNANATTDGTPQVYFKYMDTMYLDSGATQAMTGSANPITVPKLEYTVTYNANGGEANKSTDTSKYVFNGYWSGDEDTAGAVKVISPDGYVVDARVSTIVKESSNLNLYARWGQDSVRLTTAQRTGYTLEGWYSDSELTNKVGERMEEYVPTADVTLYAKWTPNEIAMKWNSEYGTVSDAPDTCTYDDTFTTPAAMTVTGYTFGGWRIGTDRVFEPSTLFKCTKEVLGTAGTTTAIFRAIWTANTFNIAYANGGGTGSAPTSPTSCTYAGTCTAPANTYTRAGYEFNGWACTASSGACAAATYAAGADISKATTVAGATITLTATWKTGAEKTITLDAAGGVIMSGSSVVSGSTCTVESADIVLPTPTKTGYTFVGWYNAAGTRVTTIAKGTCTEDISLTARWTANNYTITLDNAGATTNGTASIYTTYNTNVYLDSVRANAMTTSANPITKPSRVYTVTYNANSGAVSPTSATSTYTFKGYYSAASNGTQYINASGNITSDGLTAGKGYSAAATWNAQWTGAAVTLPTPTRTGYTFGGWYSNSSLTTKVGDANRQYTPTANVTLYAKWTPITYRVPLRADDATTSGTSYVYVVHDDAIYLDGDTTQEMTGSANPIAKPKREYVVTYNANSGSVTPASVTAAYTFGGFNDGGNGLAIDHLGYVVDNQIGYLTNTTNELSVWNAQWVPVSVTLPTPTRAGYTFGGWYSNSSLTNRVGDAGASYMPTANVTLYAKWTANTYTVTLDSNGGTGGSASVLATYDAMLPAAEMPTRAEYDFRGYWSAKTGGKQYYDMKGAPIAKWDIAKTTTLYAQWTEKGKCVPGMYYDGNEFIDCPKGYYCPGIGRVTLGVPGCSTACPNGYVDGGTGYSSETQCEIAVPQGSYLVTAKGTEMAKCANGTYTASVVNVAYGKTNSCSSCEANNYCEGGTKYSCSALGAGYTSDAGVASATQCYQRCALSANASVMSGRDYYGTEETDTCVAVSCVAGYTLKDGKCELCPENHVCAPEKDNGKPYTCSELTGGIHKLSSAGSGKVADCYATCEEYDIEYGTAIPVSKTEYWPVQCQYEGVSETGNPCDIVDGVCVENACNYNYEMVAGKCEPCARENAVSYKKDGGNCIVESCVSGFHPNGQSCEENTIECSAPNSKAASQVWNSAKNAFGECMITECNEGYHLGANACQLDEQVCDLEHGVGVREWDHNTNTWGDCVATKCDPGYTNDRSLTNELWKQCGRCNNMYSAGGELAASSYVDGCEIASCMYEGELYTLENNECLLICDEYSDETGTRRWNASRKKCERTCTPGYMPW